MDKLNEQEMKIIKKVDPYKEKRILKSLSFLRTPMLFMCELYAFVALIYLIAQDLGIVQKEIDWFSWTMFFCVEGCVLYYERAIAFQIINKLTKR